MNKPKPTNKHATKRGRKTKIEMIFDGNMKGKAIPFHEFIQRIVRVNPQEIKLPKQ
ncbi:MAG: hypothetical protein NTX44_02130 [Ignavibacteriales bacterium]|nr:hypothetical protein [Ignavibacteriales bacterium]